MKIQKALIIYKKSAYESYFSEYKSPVFKKLAKVGDKGLAHIKRSHDVHYSTLKHVESVLRKHKVSYDKRARGKVSSKKHYDLIVAVGGDGTFLNAAHAAKNELVLGVNSDTNHSVGQFCGTHVKNFEGVFKKILQGKLSVRKINRLKLVLNGKMYRYPVLNELLICHSSPAAMSHYILSIGDKKEQQRSSGLWIATAAGSTGAVCSAGGKILPPTSLKIQYKPRELFDGHGATYKLRGAVLGKNQKIRVISQMQEGMIYIDGAHTRVPFSYGSVIEVFNSEFPLFTPKV